MASDPIQTARLYLLSLEIAGKATVRAGVLLYDPSTDGLYLRLRRDWNVLAPPADADVLGELQDDLENKAAEMGAARLLTYLSESLSNVVRISEPEEVAIEGFDRALGRLYRQHVDARPLPF